MPFLLSGRIAHGFLRNGLLDLCRAYSADSKSKTIGLVGLGRVGKWCLVRQYQVVKLVGDFFFLRSVVATLL